MEIHNLSVSMCPEEVEKWLIERSSSSQLQVLSFTSLNGEFALKLQYKGISFPLRFKMVKCELSLVHLEIISLPPILSLLPLSLLFSDGGVRLKGRELWLDFSLLSGGRIADLELEEILFQPESIRIKLRNLVLKEPFA
ncbi:MAG: hypothetical protein GX766_09010 [Firmicutes bacterium]|nr:hypothetical protein [Bacillota bacterium]HQD40640.1 hypothetical protein [Bacillota bacterium]